MDDDLSAESNIRDDGLAVFVTVRPRLFGIAYRILRSVVEAEDIVQDAWLRWQATDRCAVVNAPAFLATTTTRLAINLAHSARSRRETYLDSWLPEPVDTRGDPNLGAEQGEALGFAVLLLLERLTPAERAAYVLREAFDYPYLRIAEVLHLSEVNARQHVSRARKHIARGRRALVSAAERRHLLSAFIEAAQEGDVAHLEQLFASDVISSADGGAIVRATRTPVSGRERVPSLSRASLLRSRICRTDQASGTPTRLTSPDLVGLRKITSH